MTKVNLTLALQLAVETPARFVCLGFRGGLDFRTGQFPEVETGDRPDMSGAGPSNRIDSPLLVGRISDWIVR